MFDIIKKLKGYKKEAILGPLFKLFEAIFELAIPLIIASLIDNGLKCNNTNHVITMSVLLVIFPLIGLLFSITAQYFSAVAAVGVSSNLRSELFKKVQSLSYSEYDTIGTSNLINVMTSDVNQLQTGINLMLRLLLRSPIVVLGSSIMALIVDVHLGLIFLLVTIILSLIVFIIMKITIPLYIKNQNKLDKVLKSTRENLSGVRVIRAFNYEDNEIEKFKELNKDLTYNQLHVGKISVLLNNLTYMIINGAIIVLIYFGAIKVNIGDLSQGKVIALYNYMSLILVELIKFANLLITLNKSIASSKRISNLLNTNSSLKHSDNADINVEESVIFNDVSLNYQGSSKESLKNISFKVLKGQTVGIIGATGSGKTSLINLIPHFYDISKGNIYVDGKDVSSYKDEDLINKIGIVPQKSVLFKGTIKDNLLWGNENATDEELLNAVSMAQAMDVINSKEDGLNALVLQDGKNFSGGQRQRLAIARALVKKPEILILDDSTSALDFATEAKVKKAISSLEYNPTVFIVSQRTMSIKNADQIIVLDKGNLIDIGTHEDLLNRCEIYKEIHESQIKKEDE